MRSAAVELGPWGGFSGAGVCPRGGGAAALGSSPTGDASHPPAGPHPTRSISPGPTPRYRPSGGRASTLNLRGTNIQSIAFLKTL